MRDNALAFCGPLRLSCYIVARERGNWFLRAIWPCFRHGTSIVSALRELSFFCLPSSLSFKYIYFHWHTVTVPVFRFSVDIQYLYTTFNGLVRMIGMSATVPGGLFRSWAVWGHLVAVMSFYWHPSCHLWVSSTFFVRLNPKEFFSPGSFCLCLELIEIAFSEAHAKCICLPWQTLIKHLRPTGILLLV